jgi:hypothetical protein
LRICFRKKIIVTHKRAQFKFLQLRFNVMMSVDWSASGV